MSVQAEEGGHCPFDDCDGIMRVDDVENCSCHISPPCAGCTSAPLVCSACGWEYEEEVEPMNNDVPQSAWRDLRHTCSYYCHKPDCIRAQRDYLRDKMEDTESNEELKRQNKKLIDTLHDAKALLLFWIERNGYNANDFDDTLTMRDINKLLAGANEET